MYRIKEIQKGEVTQYVLQQRTFWFFWWTISEPVDDKIVADGLLILFQHREYKRKLKKK